MKTKSSRLGVISWLTYLLGGYNANAGTSWGRLELSCPDVGNDEAVARHILSEHESDIEQPLKKEIAELKAKLYDYENPKRKRKIVKKRRK